MKLKVSVLRELHEKHIRKIKQPGIDIAIGPDYSADIVIASGKVDNFSRYRKLKWIHSTFAGVDALLTDEVRKSNVIITNSRGVHSIPASEHILALMLAFERKLKDAITAQHNRQWRKPDSIGEFHGKTVGILGMGRIGTAVAGLCKGFGCEIIVLSKEIAQNKFIDKLYTAARLNKFLAECDYLAICLPLTKETKHIIGKRELKFMKKSAIIINVGRGAVIDEKALAEALKNGWIAGAGLDVFEEEPLPTESPLWKMENVIITAHYAGHSQLYGDRIIDIFLRNLQAFIEGRKMINVVDKKRGY